VSDQRAPPDYGRIAWPEDIFGSLEVDGRGEFVEAEDGKKGGHWMRSGTYRIITREGMWVCFFFFLIRRRGDFVFRRSVGGRQESEGEKKRRSYANS